MSDSSCKHDSIQSWRFDDGSTASLWSCRTCSARFEPTAETQAEIERLRAENAATKENRDRWQEEAAKDVEVIAQLRAENAALAIGHARYETVRRFNVQQFKDAYKLCLSTGKPFDQIVDELATFRRNPS